MIALRFTTRREYFASLPAERRAVIKALDALIRRTAPELKPCMCAGMPGYGLFHYRNRSGNELDWPVLAIAAQKNYYSLYCCAVDKGRYLAEIYKPELPKASIGKSCIGFKRLEDLPVGVLRKLLKHAARVGGMNAG